LQRSRAPSQAVSRLTAASAAVEAPGSELASRQDTLRMARRTKVWEVGV
jgi:hypothetical protein